MERDAELVQNAAGRMGHTTIIGCSVVPLKDVGRHAPGATQAAWSDSTPTTCISQ
jgi:hypothetical protein